MRVRTKKHLVVLLVTFAFACSSGSDSPTRPEEKSGKRLTLAETGESVGIVLKNGQILTNTTGYTVKLIPKPGFKYHKGSRNSGSQGLTIDESTTTISDASVVCPSFPPCVRNIVWNDGFDEEGENPDGTLWNGFFKAELRTSSGDFCSADISFNHVDILSSNGDLLDTHAEDQKVTFFVNSSNNCSGTPTVTKTGGGPALPTPSSPLTASIDANATTTWGFLDETFQFKAISSGGLPGTKKYKWEICESAPPVCAGNNPEVWDNALNFTTQNPVNHTFTQSGNYVIRVLVRDGNNSTGSHYRMSGIEVVDVSTRPLIGADEVSNTLPGVVWAFSWYATSVTLKNIGTQTWSGSAYKMSQMPSQVWEGSPVSLGGATVATNQTHTFNFNLATFEPGAGWQNNYWKIEKNGSQYDDYGGRTTFVKGTQPIIQGEVVHLLRKEDLPLPVSKIQEDGEFLFRYYASLVEPWDVDFYFHVVFDPSVFNVGQVVKHAKGENHRVKVRSQGPGDVIIEGVRTGAAGLDGNGLVFEIPLQLLPGATVPATLPLVEVMATK